MERADWNVLVDELGLSRMFGRRWIEHHDFLDFLRSGLADFARLEIASAAICVSRESLGGVKCRDGLDESVDFRNALLQLQKSRSGHIEE